MTDDEINKLNLRLNVIINLMLRNAQSEGKAMTDADKIKILSDMNLNIGEISEITGKSQQNIGTVLRRMKSK